MITEDKINEICAVIIIFLLFFLGGIYECFYIHWCNECKQFQLKEQDYGSRSKSRR